MSIKPQLKKLEEQEYREEAERLAKLPPEDQKEILSLHRSTAENPKAPKRERELARERLAALERHLRRLNRKEKM
jgi:hypothetical protein